VERFVVARPALHPQQDAPLGPGSRGVYPRGFLGQRPQVGRQGEAEGGEAADAQEGAAGRGGAVRRGAGAQVEHGSVRSPWVGESEGGGGTAGRIPTLVRIGETPPSVNRKTAAERVSGSGCDQSSQA